jgi:hypothetical protein
MTRSGARVLGGLALVAVSASLSGCAFSSNSTVTFDTNAKVAAAVERPKPNPHFQQRYDRVAEQIIGDASTVPTYRRQHGKAGALRTDGLNVPLKGGGFIFMELKAPLAQHSRHRLDVHKAVELYVEQQGTHDGTKDFFLYFTKHRSQYSASCQHGKYAVAEFDSRRSDGALFDVGKKNKGYHGGHAAANQLLGRLLNSALNVVNTTNTALVHVTPHADPCQGISVATFGHGLRG